MSKLSSSKNKIRGGKMGSWFGFGEDAKLNYAFLILAIIFISWLIMNLANPSAASTYSSIAKDAAIVTLGFIFGRKG